MHGNRHSVKQNEGRVGSQQKNIKPRRKEKPLDEMEVSNFLDKEFNVLVIKVLRNLGRRLDE